MRSNDTPSMAKPGIIKQTNRILKPGHSRLISHFGPPRKTTKRSSRPEVYKYDCSADFASGNWVTPMIAAVLGPRLTNGIWADNGLETVAIYNGSAGLSVSCDNNMYMFRLNLSDPDNLLAAIANYDVPTSADSSGVPFGQMSGRAVMCAWRDDGGVYPCYVDCMELNDSALGDQATQHSTGNEHYHHTASWFEGIGVARNTSNGPQAGVAMFNYTGGTGALTNSAKSAGAAYQQRSICPVGGHGDGMRQRYDHRQTYPKRTMVGYHWNDGDANNAVDSDAVGIDLLHFSWDGTTDGGGTTITATDAFDLPNASGVEGTLVPMDFGNLFIQHDEPGSPYMGVVPITWDGTTPTPGSYVDWKYKEQYPTQMINWDLVGGTQPGRSILTHGEWDGANEFRTLFFVAKGSDVWCDTIKIKFYQNGDHYIETIYKDVFVQEGHTSAALGYAPIVCNQGKDLAFLQSAGDAPVFQYIKSAWGD